MTDLTQTLADPARVAALRALHLMDTPAEEAFDRLGELARRLLHAPIALVALVDHDRQFLKSGLGLPEACAGMREMPLSHSLCKYAVAGRQPLLIHDTRRNPMFSDNGAVRDLGVVAYAGIPLLTSDGYAVGSFCVVDTQPRRWTEAQISTLQDLTALAMTEIERRATEAVLRSSEQRYRAITAVAQDGIVTADANGRILSWNRGAEVAFGYTADEIIGRSISCLIPEPLREDHINGLMRRVESGEAATGGQAMELHGLRKDGTEFPLELSLASWDANGEIIFSAVIRDITERKRAEDALRRSERHYRNVFESAHDAILILHPENETVLEVNERACEMYGISREEFVGRSIRTLSDGSWPVGPPSDARTGRGPRTGHFLIKHRGRGGEMIHVEVNASVVEYDGEEVVLSINRDVTARKAAEQALQESEARFHGAFAFTSIGMALVAPDGRWLQVNQALCKMVGFTEEEFRRSDFQSITHPDDLELDLDFVDKVLRGELQSYEMEKRYIHKDGHTVWALLSVSLVRDSDGEPLYFVSHVQDISERKAFEEQLRHQALHDGLTGLPNRALFMDRLSHALQASARRGTQVAVLFLDLDGFKTINDSLGHAVGDEVLKAAAGRVRSCLRAVDTAARLGGDEFTVLVEDLRDEAEATHLAERILRALAAPFQVGGQEVYTSASIGIVTRSGRKESASDLLRQADVAMYRSKSAGRGRCVVFRHAMSVEAEERLRLETELRRAIEKEEFRIFYQPIVRMATGCIVGAEALVRWEHPRRGLMPPDSFISVQEQIGLIEPFTLWVLREVQSQCLDWLSNGYSVPVSVNLSPFNLNDPDFADGLVETLALGGLPPSLLKLEITESAVMMNPAQALESLQRFAAIGLRLAMDDFGTGYSSLSYLKKLPVHEVKIDKSFIMGMDERDESDSAIVRAIVDLAHNLGKTVVAEGVETERVWDMLRVLGCDAAQGFYMGAPMPAALMADWLQGSRWRPSTGATSPARLRLAAARR